MDLSKLGEFVNALNKVHGCKTPRCEGEVAPVQVYSCGLGGGLSVAYACTECAVHRSVFETSCVP